MLSLKKYGLPNQIDKIDNTNFVQYHPKKARMKGEVNFVVILG